MQFPIIVIGYGNFVQTSKLFFYEIGGLGCLPIFTDPTMATLFMASATERMKDLLIDKPKLKAMACAKKKYFLDMLQLIATMIPDVQIIELNPYPLTPKFKQKLVQSKVTAKSDKYSISELISMLQSESDESNTR